MRKSEAIVHELNVAYQEHRRSMWLSVEDIQPIMHEVWQQACTEAAHEAYWADSNDSPSHQTPQAMILKLRDSRKLEDF